MSEELFFDYGFINKFNELKEEEKQSVLRELLALQMDSDQPEFSQIGLSEYFAEEDLQTNDPLTKQMLHQAFIDKLDLPHYRLARGFIQMMGQSRQTPVSGFKAKNEPIVYHIYKLLTGRSLKRDLNLQQAIYNDPQKTIIAPVVINLEEIRAHMEDGMDVRVDLSEELIRDSGDFLLSDESLLGAKLRLYLALRGYYGIDLSFKAIREFIPEVYQTFDQEIYSLTFPFASDVGQGITPVVDNDDRNRLELGWMIAYIRFHDGEKKAVQAAVKPLIKELSVFSENDEIEAFRYLATMRIAFSLFSE